MANKLINEESPYLQQHINNPVEWYPWCVEAFELAKKLNKPIFLSIGYSACHWCHVMERESFNSEEIAKKLNQDFVSIKVDKEERPDIDRHFQEIFIKMNNKAGGWPLSIFMTPNKTPFYSATYIPPIANYGMMGFGELIDVIANSYKKDASILENKGQEVLNAIEPKNKIEATKITPQLIDILKEQIKNVYEPNYGGFGSAPKFPHASTLISAIDLYKLTDDRELKDIIANTLDNMLLGGLYDIVDGGFCRYSTDDIWLVPHFEKMTYDNALMAKVLIKAYRAFEIKRYKELAQEIIDFMVDKMSQDNLFFSASDADSNGIEGEYFIYDYNEAKEAFEKVGVDMKLLYELSISKNGNFDGKNIVRFRSIKLRESEEAKKALCALKDLRKTRPYPFIDKKIISSWNAMMIDAIFEFGKLEPKYIEIANNTLSALEVKMVDGVEIYHSALITNKPKILGFLEDYSWMINAYICAYSATLDEVLLIKASKLANEAIRKFYKDGMWQISDKEFKNFEEDFDTSYTSSVSLMVHNLLTLRSLVEPIYEKFVFKTLEVNSYNLMRQPISRPTLANATIRYLKDDIVIKSKEDNLKKIVSKELKYPYVLLKTTLDEQFNICNNSSCFARVKELDELKSIVK